LEIEELDAQEQARLDAITRRIDELEDRPGLWPSETLSIAGIVVTLGRDGTVSFHEGLIKPEDRPRKSRTRTDADEEGHGQALPLSASLRESLTAHRSAAITAMLIEHPHIALVATVHALAAQLFYGTHRDDAALQITATAASLHRVEGSTAAEAIEKAEGRWIDRLPGDPGGLFAWCLAQPPEGLIELLAFCAARTVNAVVLKTERDESSRATQAALIAGALNLDMATWFRSDAANYFSKIAKPQIIEALREIKGAVAPAWSGMKKAELAGIAEREAASARWLPEVLRMSPQD
jgi:ParB family chromosome partitioning protein